MVKKTKTTGRQKNKRIKLFTSKDILPFILALIPIICVLFMIVKTGVGLILLQTHGTKTKAVVTSTVVYTKIRSNPHYVYKFQHRGNIYEGNSLIEEKDVQRVGDSIDVLFLEFWPTMNRPTYYFK